MQVSEYKKSAAASVSQALELDTATVSNERVLLYPRLLCAPWRHYLGAAYAARVQISELNGSRSSTNVVVSLWQEDGQEHIGFWAGDAFLSACKTSVDAARKRAASAARYASKPEAALDALLASHAVLPTATDCGFWKGWRRDRSISPHVAAVLARHHLTGHRVLDELREIVVQFAA